MKLRGPRLPPLHSVPRSSGLLECCPEHTAMKCKYYKRTSRAYLREFCLFGEVLVVLSLHGLKLLMLYQSEAS